MSSVEGSFSQICYVVNDLQASALEWTRTTGAGPWYVMASNEEDKRYRGGPGRDRYLAALGFIGTTSIELFQPLDDEPSILREVLDVRGEGVHHVMPRIRALSGASFDAQCEQYERLGLKAATTCVIPGIGRAAFYDALSSIGSFIEVLELGPSYMMLDVMSDAHAGWDGADPLRTFDELVAAVATPPAPSRALATNERN